MSKQEEECYYDNRPEEEDFDAHPWGMNTKIPIEYNLECQNRYPFNSLTVVSWIRVETTYELTPKLVDNLPTCILDQITEDDLTLVMARAKANEELLIKNREWSELDSSHNFVPHEEEYGPHRLVLFRYDDEKG
tara:strand:- start:542 stop:943 length:402 start_codon:yes stop_codon:yes gene_type:complete